MPKRPKDGEAARDPEPAPAESAAAAEEAPGEVRNPLPEPIGTVRRELVRPDGKKVYVDVPVYPPFRLENGEVAPRPKLPPRRLRPGAKPRRTGSD